MPLSLSRPDKGRGGCRHSSRYGHPYRDRLSHWLLHGIWRSRCRRTWRFGHWWRHRAGGFGQRRDHRYRWHDRLGRNRSRLVPRIAFKSRSDHTAPHLGSGHQLDFVRMSRLEPDRVQRTGLRTVLFNDLDDAALSHRTAHKINTIKYQPMLAAHRIPELHLKTLILGQESFGIDTQLGPLLIKGPYFIAVRIQSSLRSISCGA